MMLHLPDPVHGGQCPSGHSMPMPIFILQDVPQTPHITHGESRLPSKGPPYVHSLVVKNPPGQLSGAVTVGISLPALRGERNSELLSKSHWVCDVPQARGVFLLSFMVLRAGDVGFVAG